MISLWSFSIQIHWRDTDTTLQIVCMCHSAKSLLCDTVYYNVYSNISSNISCLRIEHYKQMRILKYCQSRAVSGILANL